MTSPSCSRPALAYVACLARISAEYGLTINFKSKKTEIIYVNVPNPSPVLSPGGIPINVVQDYKYLGSLCRNQDAEFLRRKGGAWAALRQFKAICSPWTEREASSTRLC